MGRWWVHHPPVGEVHPQRTQWNSLRYMRGAIPHTKCAAIPHTKYAAIPHTKCVAIPHTKYAAIPHTKCASIPHTKYAAIPHTKCAAIPHTKCAAIPHTKSAASVLQSHTPSVPQNSLTTLPPLDISAKHLVVIRMCWECDLVLKVIYNINIHCSTVYTVYTNVYI